MRGVQSLCAGLPGGLHHDGATRNRTPLSSLDPAPQQSLMSYTNKDLAATLPGQRTWKTWNFAALWISMSLCIPTYMLASSLIQGGMNWWQAILTIFLGNAIVLIPMI